MKKYIHLTLVLFIISAVSGAILSVVNAFTVEPIAIVEKNKRDAGIAKIFTDLDPEQTVEEVIKNNDVLKGYYVVKDANGEILGYVFKIIAPKPYKEINFLVGIDKEGKIVSTSYLPSKETPGLGMNIDPDKASNKSVAEKFNAQFPGLTSVKDNKKFTVDTIAGATISSSAVVNGIDEALKYFNKNIGIK